MAWQSTVAVVAFLLVPPAIGWTAFTADVWWPVVFPESAVLLSLGSAVLVSYATEGRQKAFIKRGSPISRGSPRSRNAWIQRS